MRSRSSVFALVSVVTACTAGAGCSSSEQKNEPDLGTQLEDETKVRWAVGTDERSGEVRYLAPERPVRVGDGAPEEAARTFFDRHRASLHGTGEPDELRAVPAVVEDDGSTRIRFDHYLPGTDIRVLGAATTAYFTAGGELYWAQPGFRADLSRIGSSATIIEEDALRAAVDRASTQCMVARDDIQVGKPELAVRADEDAPAALVWRVQLLTQTEACYAPEILVDAATGAVVAMRETSESIWDRAGGVRFHHMGETTDMKTIDVTNHALPFSAPEYVMESELFTKVITRRYVSPKEKPRDIVSRTLGVWETDPRVRGAAVDAHFNGFHALRYFAEVHKRRGLDGGFGNLVLVVHDNVTNPYGKNAHYVGSDGLIIEDDIVHIGDGDFLAGGDWLPLSAAFDVIVHECAHAVTKHTSGLVYREESGALNESFSDVMAAAAEEWFETKDAARNFTIGERFTKSGSGLRNMLDPGSLGQPSHTKAQRRCAKGESPVGANDHCYVHSTSGIPNRAFSLMTVGGVHETSKIAVAKGIGWAVARDLWYRTFTGLHPQSTLFQAAVAQVSHASRLGPETLQSVACAWNAVGVLTLHGLVHPALEGMACPAPSSPRHGSTCEGVANGYVCNEHAPFSAFFCVNGAIAGGVLCSDGSKRCKKASPEDFTATLGSDGSLVCE